MNEALFLILLINLVGAIGFAIVSKNEKNKCILAVYFLFVPILGFMIYFIPRKIVEKKKNCFYDRDSFVKRLDIEKIQEIPTLQKELDVIPVEDAMAVGSNLEKRNLLLEQLKKDIYSNYKVLLAANDDADSESAHYVAAAKMEVYRYINEEVLKAKSEFEGDETNVDKIFGYLEKLSEYIESELLSEKEKNIYMAKYCEVINIVNKNPDITFLSIHNSNFISYLVELKRYDEAENFWNGLRDEERDEKSYMNMLLMYYKLKKKNEFYDCIAQIEQSSIKLSAESLQFLRYWKKRNV
jgi:hypothetical protein